MCYGTLPCNSVIQRQRAPQKGDVVSSSSWFPPHSENHNNRAAAITPPTNHNSRTMCDVPCYRGYNQARHKAPRGQATPQRSKFSAIKRIFPPFLFLRALLSSFISRKSNPAALKLFSFCLFVHGMKCAKAPRSSFEAHFLRVASPRA